MDIIIRRSKLDKPRIPPHAFSRNRSWRLFRLGEIAAKGTKVPEICVTGTRHERILNIQ
jgi:hypothetical protein